MRSRKVIVDKIVSWLGCHEGDPVHKHIIDTYNAHKPLARGYKVKYTDAWCATTVSAAAIECGYTDIIPTECSCQRMIELMKKKGIWVENDAYVPSPGDIIFYDWQDSGVGDDVGYADHVGIVSDVVNNTISVIEGNMKDGVNIRYIKINGRYIRGYGVPKYDKEAKPANHLETIKGGKKGIDISACQNGIDFAKVKQSGVDFVILRSTTKDGSPDTKFEQYYTNAKKAGLEIQGVYKYSYAMNPPSAWYEAKSVVDMLKGRKMTIWYDMEDKSQIILPKIGIANIATAFLDYCQASGYDVGIYCNLTWYKNYIDDSLKKKYKFWIARYGKNTGKMDESYKPNVGEYMWQYTSKGSVPGISGNVDLDIRY